MRAIAVMAAVLVVAGCSTAGSPSDAGGEGGAVAAAVAEDGGGGDAGVRPEGADSTEETGSPVDPGAALAAAAVDEAARLWSAFGDYGGPIEIHGDVVVARDYGPSPDVLRGLDLATGAVLWSRESSRGGIVPEGFRDAWSFETTAGEPVLLNLSPVTWVGDRAHHEVELVDPETGELLAEPEERWTASSWECAVGGGLCLSGSADGADDWETRRVDPATLEWSDYEPEAIEPGVDDARALAGGVRVEVGPDGVEQLVRREDGEVAWRVDVDHVFGGAVFDGLIAASVREHPDGDVLWLTATPGLVSGGVDRVAAKDLAAASLDLSTGEVLVRRDGAAWCRFEVLCAEGLALVETGPGDWEYEVADVALEGVDARTGATRWRRTAAGLALAPTSASATGFGGAGDAWLVAEQGTAGVIDPATGVFTAFQGGSLACREPLFTQDAAFAEIYGADDPILSGHVFRLCDAAGADVAGPWSRAAVDAAAVEGVTADGRRIGVVVKAGALVAYDLDAGPESALASGSSGPSA
ncbi:PQQ-binding-like beta-propeller repeat protein [Demequina pelophila]|uniref:PQQ-binding-like beta-propeller repeat protein n=1 Tax=Demequina pelophila TaxID=1638984 RepID=UPI00078335ED|nr:PQQ-binding-like beta-propeller repeat protein [Demequina pelophila]